MCDLGLNENATKMEILQQIRGRLASDTYSFEQPLRREANEKLYSNFYVRGMRHRNLPTGWSHWLKVNDKVRLLKKCSHHPIDKGF